MSHVYINDFIQNFYCPLYGPDATTKTKNRFAIALYDLDFDGNISPKDLVMLEEKIDIHSKVGRELTLIKEYFVRILHTNNGKLKDSDVCAIENIEFIIPDKVCCIVEEVIKKSLCKPGKYSDESVLIPNREDIEIFQDKQRKMMMITKGQLDDKDGPKAIIGVGDKDPHRVRKMVTWKPNEQDQKPTDATMQTSDSKSSFDSTWRLAF